MLYSQGFWPIASACFGSLLLGAQAPGTQVKPLWLTVLVQGYRVYIGQPATVGMPHRMADIMAELW